ncbi:MAG TPA: GNAT family N-acetyltransferase, partial [Caulobacteraceae bacterium]|nr:GNAT family N-acetyltransferase [Caulobacteraceae bacterium]
MDETEELIRLCGRASVAQMSDVLGFELHMARNCVLGLTGEPLADFNGLTIGPNPDAEGFLTRSIARVSERGLPLVAVMSPYVAPALAPIAARLGLTPAGEPPLMVLRAGTAARASRPIKVTRALGADLVRIAGDLAAAAFGLPRDAVARCIDVGITETAGVAAYIAWDDDEPVSAVTVTPTGTAAGIWGMATPPEHQGKGAGRALLAQVIDDYRRRGVERFFLVATEA